MVIQPPLSITFNSSASGAADLFYGCTISWKSSLASLANDMENSVEDNAGDNSADIPPAPSFPSISFVEKTIPTLIPCTTSSLLLDGTTFFTTEADRLQYYLLQCVHTTPEEESKAFIQAHYEEVLQLLEDASRTVKGVQWDQIHMIIDHWYELGIALFFHALRMNQYSFKDIVGLADLSVNQFNCYMALLSTNLVPPDDIIEWLMPTILLIEDTQLSVWSF